MSPFKIRKTVSEDGTLVLDDLPFRRGDEVEVTLVPLTPSGVSDPWEKLRGSVLRYDRPTDPVASEDWEAGS